MRVQPCALLGLRLRLDSRSLDFIEQIGGTSFIIDELQLNQLHIQSGLHTIHTTASLIASLCRDEQIEEEVATKLVEGMATPCRRPNKKRRKAIGNHMFVTDFNENFPTGLSWSPSSIRLPPRKHETQASYWANEGNQSYWANDSCMAHPKSVATVSTPKKYTLPSDAY